MSYQEKIKGNWKTIQVSSRMRTIEAGYDRLKDFRMDSKGYFLIRIDLGSNQIQAGFCSLPEHLMRIQIIGKNAQEILNTILRENLVSTLQHAGDLGIELYKAELALRYRRKYVQDEDCFCSTNENPCIFKQTETY